MVLVKKPRVDNTWISEDGTVWNIKDMSTLHIENTIKYLQARIWLEIKKLIRDHDEKFVDPADAYEYQGPRDPHKALTQDSPAYRGLVREASRRGYYVISISDKEAKQLLKSKKARKKQNA